MSPYDLKFHRTVNPGPDWPLTFITPPLIYILFLLCSTKAFARTIDTNIDGIDDNLYPGVKSAIKSLQEK